MAANRDNTSDASSRSSSASKETKSKNARRSRSPWILPTVITVVLAVVVAPVAAFVIGYLLADVPEPGDIVNKQVSQIYASDGSTEIARIVPPEGNRVAVNIADVPEVTKHAVLAAEDREFYSNAGFSFTGFGRAIVGQITGDESAGGGSTITQQYVKNSLVGNERSFVRKAKELVYSVKMSNEWSKDDVLQGYLNTIYFGRNSYGIDAAAKAYFGVPVKDLNAAQSAVLAASIQRPSQLDPWTNRPEAEARWNYVLDGMVSSGWLSAQERAGLVYPETLDPATNTAYVEADGANGLIKNQVIAELASLGISEDQVQTLGLRITTTIDNTAQQATVDAVNNNMPNQQPNVRVASVSVEPKTGAVRAYYGGADAGGYDYANAGLQAGSTFKIFGLAAALQQGIPTSAYYSSAPYTLSNGVVANNSDGETCGSCSLKQALLHSYNTSFLRLQDDLQHGTRDTADMAHALGVAPELPGIGKTLHEDNGTPFEGIILGQYQVRPIDMAHALATLSNYGVRHNTYFVQKVETASGQSLYEHAAEPGERVVSKEVATNVLDAMAPIAAYSNGNALANRPSAAKTGTTQLGDTGQNKDAWMIGSTPQLATAVWAGTNDNTALLNSWGGLMYGSNLPAQLWRTAMNGALVNDEVQAFDPPTGLPWAGGGYATAPAYTPPATVAPEAPATTTAAPTTKAPAPAPTVPSVPALPSLPLVDPPAAPTVAPTAPPQPGAGDAPEVPGDNLVPDLLP